MLSWSSFIPFAMHITYLLLYVGRMKSHEVLTIALLTWVRLVARSALESRKCRQRWLAWTNDATKVPIRLTGLIKLYTGVSHLRAPVHHCLYLSRGDIIASAARKWSCLALPLVVLAPGTSRYINLSFIAFSRRYSGGWKWSGGRPLKFADLWHFGWRRIKRCRPARRSPIRASSRVIVAQPELNTASERIWWRHCDVAAAVPLICAFEHCKPSQLSRDHTSTQHYEFPKDDFIRMRP